VIDAATLRSAKPTARKRGAVAGTIVGGDTGGSRTGVELRSFLVSLIDAGGLVLTRRGVAFRCPVVAPGRMQAGAGD
jgi:hypothetical protein